jgi:hypothetical protein
MEWIDWRLRDGSMLILVLRVVTFVGFLVGGLAFVCGVIEVSTGMDIYSFRTPVLSPEAVKTLGVARIVVSIPILLVACLLGWIAQRKRRRAMHSERRHVQDVPTEPRRETAGSRHDRMTEAIAGQLVPDQADADRLDEAPRGRQRVRCKPPSRRSRRGVDAQGRDRSNRESPRRLRRTAGSSAHAAPPDLAYQQDAIRSQELGLDRSPLVRRGPSWRWLAFLAVLVAGAFAAMEGADRFHGWSKEGREQEQVEKQAAEKRSVQEKRRRKARLVEEFNRKHPEKLRDFKQSSQVRILGSAPDIALRGLRASVWSRQEVHDPESGVVWKATYTVQVLPHVEPGFVHVFNLEYVDAEHLALIGSLLELEDRRKHPKLAAAAAEQDARIEEGKRWMKSLQARIPIRVGDPVEIRDSDPRPSPRRRRGQVISVISSEPQDHPSGGTRLPLAECEVWLSGGSSRPLAETMFLGTVRVNLWHLKHAGK